MNWGNRMKARNEKKSPATAMGMALGIMYVVSAVLLLALSALLYNFELSEATIKIGVVAIYILSGFVGGFWMGKQMQDKKYLWGLMIGGIYFVLLFVVSLVIKVGTGEELSIELVRIVTTLLLCAVSGMAGGMIS
ncbi:MAG: TIGR04086 family membrane protein [Lachnospiraceae bacterium]|nr:TIGR04086 family membrane protein [Lachnospiraceae bacterium]